MITQGGKKAIKMGTTVLLCATTSGVPTTMAAKEHCRHSILTVHWTVNVHDTLTVESLARHQRHSTCMLLFILRQMRTTEEGTLPAGGINWLPPGDQSCLLCPHY